MRLLREVSIASRYPLPTSTDFYRPAQPVDSHEHRERLHDEHRLRDGRPHEQRAVHSEQGEWHPGVEGNVERSRWVTAPEAKQRQDGPAVDHEDPDDGET